MKKFMTDIKTLAALLMAGAAFTACSSDDSIIDEQPVNPAKQTYTLTVNASKGDGSTTRALDLSGSTLTASWATTENVYVKKGSDWATGSLQPEADGTTATLKGSLTGITIDANDNLTLQFPKSGDITYAGQQGTLADIQANFDWATANVEVESVSASGNINPKAATTTFTNQQAIIKFTLKDKANDAAISPSALTVTDGTSTVSLTSIPAATYSDPKNGDGVLYVAFPAAGSAKTIKLTATVGTATYIYETATAKTFTNGQYYAITVKMTKLIVNPAVGQVIGNDGKNYAAGSLPSGVTAVAMIVYVGSDNGESAPYNHGLALALSDANGGVACKWKTSNTDAGHTKQDDETFEEESGLQYNTTHNTDEYPAFQAAIANNGTAAPTGCSAWFLASGYQWTKMFAGDAGGLKTLAGLQSSYYWSSSESYEIRAWCFVITSGNDFWYNDGKESDRLVRSCLAF